MSNGLVGLVFTQGFERWRNGEMAPVFKALLCLEIPPENNPLNNSLCEHSLNGSWCRGAGMIMCYFCCCCVDVQARYAQWFLGQCWPNGTKDVCMVL